MLAEVGVLGPGQVDVLRRRQRSQKLHRFLQEWLGGFEFASR